MKRVIDTTTGSNAMAHANRRQASGYVLVTAARDEAKYIERTIESVVAQTVLPLKWVIVSDGSSDGTDNIVAAHAAQTPWIELVSMPRRDKRHFAGKAQAFNAGYARVTGLAYEFIANLDADVSFDANFMEFVLDRLGEDAGLGVVGTCFKDRSLSYDYRFVSIEHVSGPF